MNLRGFLFTDIEGKLFTFEIVAAEEGIFAGSEKLIQIAGELGIKIIWTASNGFILQKGSVVFKGIGTPERIIESEDVLLGLIGKTSGVSTAAQQFSSKAKNKIRIVCGAWKKIAQGNKADLRHAVVIGGVGLRITEERFVYLDKNYVRMLGGIGPAVRRAVAFQGGTVVVQVRGEFGNLAEEANEAIYSGAGILMVDTGNIDDLMTVLAVEKSNSAQAETKVAFSGGITIKDLDNLIDSGVDILDVGRSIIDAPLLDFRLDVI